MIDTNTSGVRYDVTPLFADYAAFSAVVDDLAAPFTDVEIDLAAGIAAINMDDNKATQQLRQQYPVIAAADPKE
ncbi:MAG TPA: hypothetical protein ENJ93_04395 [Chloroflexi bacterium]|nr:hypothetical protein [Chloroflexota bacterium]